MILRNGILTSALLEDLPVVHGFTTKYRGNLGYGENPGDPEVSENRRILFSELQLTERRHVQPKQVHSDRCVEASVFFPGMEADAVLSHSPRDLVSVLTADCVPILLYHPEGVIAAVHAGWRGLANEIILKSLKKLPPNPIAVIGPSIGPCCYEVGEDLADEFKARFGSGAVEHKGKPHLNLAQVAIQQLHHAGVEEMDVCLFCTFCHSELFFSFRRDGSSGRMMSFIGLR